MSGLLSIIDPFPFISGFILRVIFPAVYPTVLTFRELISGYLSYVLGFQHCDINEEPWARSGLSATNSEAGDDNAAVLLFQQ